MLIHTLRIQAPASLGRHLIARSLPRFIHMHPGLRVEMLEASSIAPSLSHGADASLYVGPIVDSGSIARPIGVLRPTTCASPEFIDRWGLPNSPVDLSPTHCIALFEPGSHRVQEWSFRKGSVAHTISPTAPVAFSDVESAVVAAVHGGGYVRVLSIEADQYVASGLLRPVLDEWNEESHPITIVHSRDCIAHNELLAFSDFVVGLLPSTPAGKAVNRSRTLDMDQCAPEAILERAFSDS